MPDEKQVVWSLESSKKIEETKEYLLQEWSESEFENFLVKLRKFEKRVKRFPKLYPASVSQPLLRKAVITKHQSVIYKIDGDTIRVVTILDNRQQK